MDTRLKHDRQVGYSCRWAVVTYTDMGTNEREDDGVMSPLRASLMVMFVIATFTRSGLGEETPVMQVLMHSGLWVFVVAVLGRFWCLVYMSGRKNSVVINDGPYALCRHPLYLFTVLVVLGFGMMMGSVIVTLIATAVTARVLLQQASSEERFLISEFGETYRYYMQQTPKFFPRFIRVTTTQSPLTISNLTLRRGLLDVLLLMSLIPIAGLLAKAQMSGTIPTFPLI